MPTLSLSKRGRAARQLAFKQALIAERLTVVAFARRLGCSRTHIHRALRDAEGVAASIHAAIDALIAKHTGGR